MSKGKEYITTDDLIEMLSDIKNEELELVRRTSNLKVLDEESMKFIGKLDLFMYQFYFLGLGTMDELKETRRKILEEMENEVRRKMICQI